ncbi:MAG: signal peptide peptidase SppA [Roseibacillus sp.]
MKRVPKLAGVLSLAATTILSAAPVIPVYDLEGLLSEGGQSSLSLLSLSFSTERGITHYDLVRSLQKAAADEEVKGVVLEVDGAGFTMAQVQELQRRLQEIRKAGKDVWMYSEALSRGTALIGSVANHFVLMPEADVSLTGIYGESLYFKGLFDKIGVQVDVVHIGDFKSAGESYYRDGPSESAQKQMNELLDANYEQTVSQIAKGRGIEEEDVRAFVDSGFQTAELAKEAGLIDDLQYRTDFIKIVRAHYGEGTKFDREYELPSASGPEIDSMFDVFSLLFGSGRAKRFRRDYIAVVVLDAAITDSSIAPVRKEILAAAKNVKCRGLVFRVNSPGGSALASEVLWEATDEFKATGKPFVVSMGGVAASGGYYVAAGAERIFAERGTVTGSIGVVGMKFALGGGMDKLGITTHEIKRGRHADIMNTTRPFSEEEKALVRKSMLDIYGTFKKRITNGRGDRLKGELESMAGGRVYPGERALELGLVDELGGIHEALAYVAKKAKLEIYETYLLPEPQDLFSGLFAPAPASRDDDEFIRMSERTPASAMKAHLDSQPILRVLDPSKRAALEQFVTGLETFQNERILLLAPHFTSLSSSTR